MKEYFVIMCNDFPEGIHIGNEESVTQLVDELKTKNPKQEGQFPMYFRWYKFVPSGVNNDS